jgi:REP element-mobilizing transposase RayT
VRSHSLVGWVERSETQQQIFSARINSGNIVEQNCFTLVTYNRRCFLCEPENINLLRDSFKRVMSKHPFTIDAVVSLPNYLHCLWILRIK